MAMEVTVVQNVQGIPRLLDGFGEALAVLRRGGRVTRGLWGPGAYLRLEHRGLMRGGSGDSYEERWQPTQEDLLAYDWLEVKR